MTKKKTKKHKAQKAKKGSKDWVKFIKKPSIAFVGLFILGIVLFYSLWSATAIDQEPLRSFINFTTYLASKTLSLIGFENTVLEQNISNSSYSIDVRAGCDGIEPMVFYILAILAFPFKSGNKIISILAGIAILFFLNIIRIVSLFIIGIKLPNYFELFHGGIWQFIFITAVAVLWTIWYKLSFAKSTSAHA